MTRKDARTSTERSAWKWTPRAGRLGIALILLTSLLFLTVCTYIGTHRDGATGSTADVTCSTASTRPLPANTVACAGYAQTAAEDAATRAWGESRRGQVAEDETGFDCRVMGNRRCGATVTYDKLGQPSYH